MSAGQLTANSPPDDSGAGSGDDSFTPVTRVLMPTASAEWPAPANETLEHDELGELVGRTANANAALIRGDIDGYMSLISHADDYTLMSPLGGAPICGFDASGECLAKLARFFKTGTATLDLVRSYVSRDLIVLAMIERQRAAVGNLPLQDWSLRVTQVYRREGTEWRLVHRHADPLVRRISLEQAAAAARG